MVVVLDVLRPSPRRCLGVGVRADAVPAYTEEVAEVVDGRFGAGSLGRACDFDGRGFATLVFLAW